MNVENMAAPASLYRRITTQGLTGNALVLVVASFLLLLGNTTFFVQTLKVYPLSAGNALALATLPVMLGAATTLLLALVSFGRLSKPLLVAVLLLSSLAACYMDSYGVIFNDEMLQNISQTNVAEAADLINARMLTYLVLLGILPSLVLTRIPLHWRGWRTELPARLKLLAATLAVMLLIVLVFGNFYASFIRQHKVLRSYANPAYYVYSSIRYASSRWSEGADSPLLEVGTDARIAAGRAGRKLIVVVVGETARADRFSLNGYTRDTNPQLRNEKVISFTDFRACGTSTAVSVPCMFSLRGREAYMNEPGKKQENVLDVMRRSGAYVLWLDNNSDSKGWQRESPTRAIARRSATRSVMTSAGTRACWPGCRRRSMRGPMATSSSCCIRWAIMAPPTTSAIRRPLSASRRSAEAVI